MFALVVGNAVLLNQIDKLPLVVAVKGRDTEVGIIAEVVFRGDIQVGEITAATPGHQDFLSHLIAAVQYQHRQPPLTRGKGAKQSGSTAANNYHIGIFHWVESPRSSCQRRSISARPIFSRVLILRWGICSGLATLSSASVSIASRRKWITG